VLHIALAGVYCHLAGGEVRKLQLSAGMPAGYQTVFCRCVALVDTRVMKLKNAAFAKDMRPID
jgi:hypothetical protein